MKSLLLSAILMTVAPSYAAAVTFDLTSASTEAADGFVYSADGVSVTFTDFTFDGVDFLAVRNSSGLIVLDGPRSGAPTPPPETNSGTGQVVDMFSMIFDAAVELNSINIGFEGNTDGTETLTFTSGAGSVSTNVSTTGLKLLSPLKVNAGEVVSVFADLGTVDFDIVQASELTVTVAPVPLPPAVASFALGLGAFAMVRRRRKTENA